MILANECEKIVSYHYENCFKKSTTVEVLQDVQNKKEELILNNVKSENANQNENNNNKIDYSQKIGPILNVYKKQMDGTTILYSCQSYVGEAPENTVKRFCGMLSIDFEQCQNVRNEFLNLYNDQYDKSKNDDDTENKKSYSYMNTCLLLISNYYEIILNQIKYYWKFIVLVIAIIYVIHE
jgi:hypothetical protein